MGQNKLEKRPDPDFSKKQNQIYLWVRYKKFVTFSEVQGICTNLVDGLFAADDDVRRWYGLQIDDNGKISKKNNSVYRLFLPLVNCGIIERALLDDSANSGKFTKGYVISKKMPFFKGNAGGLEYRRHFFAEEGQECISQDYLSKQAITILKKMPSLSQIVSGWEDVTAALPTNLYLKKNAVNNSWELGNVIVGEPCIYKGRSEYGSIGYLQFNTVSKKIPENDYDGLNIARTIVAIKKNVLDIVYDNNTNTLDFCCRNTNFKWYSQLPVIVQKCLIMFDINQLNDNYVYDQNREYNPFNNIPLEAVNEIKRIFEIE